MQNDREKYESNFFTDGLDTMQINSTNNKYECDICDEDFSSPLQRTIHSILLHKLLPCIQCLKLYENQLALNEHKRLNHSNEPICCAECTIVLSSDKQLSEHLRNEHCKISCNLCESNILIENYSQHIQDTHRVSISASSHLETIFTSIKNEFNCNLCDSTALTFNRFFAHFLYLHKCSLKSLLKYLFDKCEKSNVPLQLLQVFNNPSQKLSCSQCNMKFTISIPKAFHKIYCEGFIYCKICDNYFNDSTHMHPNKNNDQLQLEDTTDSLLNDQFECCFCKIDLKSIASDLEKFIEHFQQVHHLKTAEILCCLKKRKIDTINQLQCTKSDDEHNDAAFFKIYSTLNEIEGVEQTFETFDSKMVKYLYSSDSDYDSPDTSANSSTQSIVKSQRKCEYCSFRSTSKYVFAKHLNEKHGFLLKTSTFDCNVCKKTYTNSQNLYKHNKTVHHKSSSKSIVGKRFKCSFCDFTSNGKHKIRAHIDEHVEAAYHPCNDKMIGFNCKYCHFIFWRREKLSDHILSRHTDHINESYLLCNICVASMTNLSTFRDHFAFRHFDHTYRPGDGVYQCHICRLAYPTIQFIKTHMTDAHPNYKALFCGADGCMQMIKDNQQLKEHWKKMHNSITFQCKQCFKVFEKKEFIQKHWAQVHAKTKKLRFK